MKNFITYLKEVFKPSFQTSEDAILVTQKHNLEEDLDVLDTTIKEHNVNLETLLAIYDELEVEIERVNLNEYRFEEIEFLQSFTYYDFIGEPSNVRVSFLYFLIVVAKDSPESISHFDQLFISDLFNSILGTNVDLTEKDIFNFYSFSKNKRVLNFHIPTKLLIKKIRDYAIQNTLSERLISHIQKNILLNLYPITYESATFEEANRIVTDYKYREEEIPFFLLPDYFGKKVNTILLTMDKTKAIAFSEILQMISLDELDTVKKEEIQEVIKYIGIDAFIKISNDILKVAASFKPKLKMSVYWYEVDKKYSHTKNYFKMFHENVVIVSGILKMLNSYALIKEVPISILETILKRSYTLKKELRLGKYSTDLGDLCLKILASDYGEEGVEKLKEIYNETKYKRVRKKIDLIFE